MHGQRYAVPAPLYDSPKRVPSLPAHKRYKSVDRNSLKDTFTLSYSYNYKSTGTFQKLWRGEIESNIIFLHHLNLYPQRYLPQQHTSCYPSAEKLICLSSFSLDSIPPFEVVDYPFYDRFYLVVNDYE